jgi:hypothetical protein
MRTAFVLISLLALAAFFPVIGIGLLVILIMRRCKVKRNITMLAAFYLILYIAWIATEPEKPEEKPEAPEVVVKTVRRSFPQEKPYSLPDNYAPIHDGLEGLFNEISSSFTGENVPVVILPPFKMATSSDSPVFLTHITESAYAHLSGSGNLRIVKRDYNKSKSRIKSQYILLGILSPIRNQIRLSVRLENINTGEILDVFDEYFDMGKVSGFL